MPSRFLNNININDEYSLPNADGSADQIITTDGAGQLSFVEQSTLNSGSASRTEILVKNLEGSALSKGDPVYIIGSVGASERLEVGLADAGDEDKMPCVGLLTQNLAINGEGTAIVTGKLKNLITSPIDGATPTENDTIYVKSGGGLTLTKPTGSTNLIQNVGQVGRVSTSSDGNIVVSAILRTNDVPNLTTGKIWVGSPTYTTESTVVHLDETNGRMGIGTPSPEETLHVLDTYPKFEIQDDSFYPGAFINFTNSSGNLVSKIYSYSNPGGSALELSYEGFGITANTSKIELRNGYMYFKTAAATRAAILSNGNVGIGLTNPSEKLHVNGSGIISANLGIGTTNPTTRLHVLGTTSSMPSLGAAASAAQIGGSTYGTLFSTLTSGRGVIQQGRSDGTSLSFDLLLQPVGGNVAIGKTSAGVKLDVAGDVRVNGLDNFLYTTNTNDIYTFSSSTQTMANAPNGYLWHDLLAFNYVYTTTQEVTSDGTNWSSTTLQKDLFAQKEGQAITVINSTQTGVRWTFNNTAWGSAVLLNVAFTYVASDINKNILVESSSNGTSWTTRFTNTATAGTGTKTCKLTSYSGDAYVRVTITKAVSSSNLVRMSQLRLMTLRAGDQGYGREYHSPITWDGDRNIGIKLASPTTSISEALEVNGNVKLSETAATTDTDKFVVLDSGVLKYRTGAQVRSDIGAGTGTVGGGGTTNYIPKWSNSSTLTDSGIVETSTLTTINNASFEYDYSGTTYLNVNGSQGTFLLGQHSTANRVYIHGIQTHLRFYTDNVKAAEFDSSQNFLVTNGNVGIGTTSPSYKLDVDGEARFGDNGGVLLTDDSGTSYVRALNNHLNLRTTRDADDIYFSTGTTTTTKMFIQGDTGDVGIGTTNPASQLGSTKVLDISSTGNGEIILDHTDAGVSSDIGLYSWNRNNDHLAHIKASCDGATDSAFISFHAQATGGSFTNAASNERMRITSSGDVGIGTTSPDSILHIKETTPTVEIQADSIYPSSYIDFTNNTGAVASRIYSYSNPGGQGLDLSYESYGTTSNSSKIQLKNAFMYFSTAGSIRATIGNNGNFGIGTTNPGEKLEVNGSVKATATTDAYKGYVKSFQSGGFYHSSSSSSSAVYWIPTNYISETTSSQYYNNWVAPYPGRVKTIYMRYASGTTPTATSVTFRYAVNGSTSATTFPATVTNGASTSMIVKEAFGNTDIVFNAGDRLQLGFTTNGGTRLLYGFSYTIVFEYNIT